MKITGVVTTQLRETPSICKWQEVSSGPTLAEGCCLVELNTDEGLTGLGIAAGYASQSVQFLAQARLIGEDPRTASALWQSMGDCLPGGTASAFQHARAILDVAVWDLKAKARKEPLWKTLGGTRPRANAYASWSGSATSDEKIGRWFALMSEDFGFRGGKVPVGMGPEVDLQRLALVRSKLESTTPQPELMIDAGGRWWPTEARRQIRRIESEFDLTFAQRATQSGDFLASKRLSDGIRAAVCAGDGLTSINAFLPYFHHHAANVIEIDLNYFGVTGALQLADAAYGFELPVTLSAVPGNITAHLAAAMPNFMSMEVIEPEPGDGIVTSDVQFASGCGIAGDAPGHGLSIHRELLAPLPMETGN